MLFVQADEGPTIGGQSISKFISDTVENLADGGYQLVWALIGMVIVFGIASSAKIKPWFSIPAAIGGFWAGWLAYGTFRRKGEPLFPGDIQASKLWELIFQDATAAIFVVMAGALVYYAGKSMKPVPRAILIIAAIFFASLVYNITRSYEG
jgi:hypothetical protein